MHTARFSAYQDSLYGLSAPSEYVKQFDPQSIGSLFGSPCPTGYEMPVKQSMVPKVVPVEMANWGSDSESVVYAPVGSAGLKAVGEAVLAETIAKTPVTMFDVPCCESPGPCQEEITWRAQWKGAPTTYFGDAKADQVEVAPLGNRYWIADLNPLKYERSIMLQAEPDPYRNMNGRQLLMQFLTKDWQSAKVKDPYTRQIADLPESYRVQFLTQGPPKYTDF